jgi:uncharacterized protein
MRRTLYLTAGIASVALGVIGAFLRYGKSLRLWREHGAISRVGKVGATAAFTASVVMGFVFLAMPWPLIPLGVALVSGTWIWTRPEG